MNIETVESFEEVVTRVRKETFTISGLTRNDMKLLRGFFGCISGSVATKFLGENYNTPSHIYTKLDKFSNVRNFESMRVVGF